MTEEICFLPYFEGRILTKTLKAIQMFQLGVGHSLMHPPLSFPFFFFFFYPGISNKFCSIAKKPAAVLRMLEGIKLVNFSRNFFLVGKSLNVAGCCFASSFARPRNLIPSSKKLFFQFNMSKETVKADRAQYGGCENCVTSLQHHNFPQLFSISPTTNNWTLDIFRLLFEPNHTCKSDRKQLRKNSLKLRVWVHVRRSVSFFSFIQL